MSLLEVSDLHAGYGQVHVLRGLDFAGDEMSAGNGAGPEPLLQLEAVDTYYGPIHILQGLSLQVGQGELVCLLGGNASGKSTTLKTVLGIVRPRNAEASTQVLLAWA